MAAARRVILLPMACALMACEGGVNPGSTPAGGDADASITPLLVAIHVTPTNASVMVGRSQEFVATCLWSDASEAACEDVTWSSADTAIATVSDAGQASGVAQGHTTIVVTHTATSITGRATVLVRDAALVSLAVLADAATVPVGGTVGMAARGAFEDGGVETLTASVQWYSSAPDRASVSNDPAHPGRVTGLAVGDVTITARDPVTGVSDAAIVTVFDLAAKDLRILPATVEPIRQGLSQQLRAELVLEDDSVLDVTQNATWASSDPRVGELSAVAGEPGLVRAMAPGSTVVRVEYQGLAAQTTIQVRAIQVTEVRVDLDSADLLVGGVTAVTCTATDETGADVDVTNSLATQILAGDLGTAFVREDGTVLGLGTSGADTATVAITCAYDDPEAGLVQGSASLVVHACELSAIEIAPASMTLAPQATQQLTATGRFDYISSGGLCGLSSVAHQDLTDAVTWTSSSADVATVSNQAETKGLLTVHGPPTSSATVWASFGAQNVQADVRVSGDCIETIQLGPAGVTLPEGGLVQLDVRGCLQSDSGCADPIPVAPSDVTFAVVGADPYLAVGADGQVAALENAGATPNSTWTQDVSATLQASACTGTPSTQITIEVIAALVQSITINADTTLLLAGEVMDATAEALYSDGVSRDVTGMVVWSSTTPAVASVHAGRILARAEGSTRIAAAFLDVVATLDLDVEPRGVVQLLMDCGGDHPASVALYCTCTATFTDGLIEDVSLTAAFDTLDAAVAEFPGGSRELVTKTPGTASLYCSHGGQSSPNLELTVTSEAVSSIQVTPENAGLGLGESLQYAARGTFAGATYDITQQATWSSTEPTIAAVSDVIDSKGLVLASNEEPGGLLIRATLGTVTGQTGLTVSDNCVEDLEITAYPSIVIAGGSMSLSVEAIRADGGRQDVTGQVDFSSASPIFSFEENLLHTSWDWGSPPVVFFPVVATLSQDVCGFAGESVSASVTVGVAEPVLEHLQLTCPEVLVRGFSAQCVVVGTFSEGTALNLTHSTIEWGSTDLMVLSPQGDGVLLAAAPGTTTVVATNYVTGHSALAEVTVPDCELAGIDVAPADTAKPVGFKIEYSASPVWTGADAQTCVVDLAAAGTWSIQDGAVAALRPDGVVEVIGAGSTAVELTVPYLLDEVKGTANLAGLSEALTSIEIRDPNECLTDLPLGLDCALVAVGTWEGGDQREITTQVDWDTQNTSIATVNNNIVTGAGTGSTSVVAGAGGLSHSLPISVEDECMQRIEIVPPVWEPPTGVPFDVLVVGDLSNATMVELSAGLAWENTNPDVVLTPDVYNQSIGTTPGEAVLTASFVSPSTCPVGQPRGMPVTATAVLRVSDQALTGLSFVEGDTSPLAHGAQRQLRVVGNYGGQYWDVTELADWTSSKVHVATVSNQPGSKGLINASDTVHGDVVISASMGVQSASTALTVGE